MSTQGRSFVPRSMPARLAIVAAVLLGSASFMGVSATTLPVTSGQYTAQVVPATVTPPVQIPVEATVTPSAVKGQISAASVVVKNPEKIQGATNLYLTAFNAKGEQISIGSAKVKKNNDKYQIKLSPAFEESQLGHWTVGAV